MSRNLIILLLLMTVLAACSTSRTPAPVPTPLPDHGFVINRQFFPAHLFPVTQPGICTSGPGTQICGDQYSACVTIPGPQSCTPDTSTTMNIPDEYILTLSTCSSNQTDPECTKWDIDVTPDIYNSYNIGDRYPKLPEKPAAPKN